MPAMFDNKRGNYTPDVSARSGLYGQSYAGVARSAAPEPSAVAESSVAPSIARSKRERRVDSIGTDVSDMDLSFRRVFPNAWKKDKNGKPVFAHGRQVPVSNLEVLRLEGVKAELVDDKTGLVITGRVVNTAKGTEHRPEIAVYRTTVKDGWRPDMKGKVYCDCEAFKYNLAYPNHAVKALRNFNVSQRRIAGSVEYAATTRADPGPGRIRNGRETPALCKHLAKLWRGVTTNPGLDRLIDMQSDMRDEY